MSIQIIECHAGGWLYVITDAMGELLYSCGVFETTEAAKTAADITIKTL